MEQIIIEIVKKYSAKKDVELSSAFLDIGVDWLSTFMILIECEKALNITIEETELEFKYVSDFVSFIKSKLIYKNIDKMN